MKMSAIKGFRWVSFLLLMLLLLKPLQTSTAKAEGATLPLPRYVSLRSNAVNLHVGPGTIYPVEWQYLRQGLPVEVIAEFDTWRQIRDWQGTEGWVHKSLLSGRRNVWVLHKTRPLRSHPDENSKIIAQLEPGVIGRALECQGNWCKIEIKSQQKIYRGWIKRRCVWGIYPHEVKFN